MTIRIELLGGGLAAYGIPVLKAQRYSPEEIFSKGLLFLIPFHIFSHESRFAEYERDEGLMRRLLSEYEGIKDRLGELAESGRLTEYVKRTIEEMSGKVLEHIARKHDRVREGVRSVMGGKVLEYEAKTILNEGIVLGRTETARRMVLNFTPEQISQATELSLDEIEGLKQANDFRGLR